MLTKKEKAVNVVVLSVELGISVEWLSEAANAGRIPCLLAGRKMLFNKMAVEQALLELAATSKVTPAEVAAAAAYRRRGAKR